MYLRVLDGGAQGCAYQLGAGRKDDIRTVGDGLLDKGIGVLARDGVEVAAVSTLPSNTVSSWVRPNSCWLVQELVPGARSCTKATFKWLGAVCLPGRIKSSRDRTAGIECRNRTGSRKLGDCPLFSGLFLNDNFWM